MVIIVGKLPVSQYAQFNRQATVGVASSRNAKEYDIVNKGVFTDEKIERAVEALKSEYGDLPVVRR